MIKKGMRSWNGFPRTFCSRMRGKEEATDFYDEAWRVYDRSCDMFP